VTDDDDGERAKTVAAISKSQERYIITAQV